MTKEELFDIADQILTMPYKKEDVLFLANYLMEHGRQMMLKNAELQIEVAILKEREECAKVCEEQYEHYGHDHVFAKAIRARGQG
jgi:hypothetical protein